MALCRLLHGLVEWRSIGVLVCGEAISVSSAERMRSRPRSVLEAHGRYNTTPLDPIDRLGIEMRSARIFRVTARSETPEARRVRAAEPLLLSSFLSLARHSSSLQRRRE